MSDDVNRWRPNSDGDHDRLIILETEFREFRRSNDLHLGRLNELREQYTGDREHDQGAYLRVDVYNAHSKEIVARLEAALKDLQSRVESNYREQSAKIEGNYKELTAKLDPLVVFPARMAGAGAVIIVITTILGTLIGHFWK